MQVVTHLKRAEVLLLHPAVNHRCHNAAIKKKVSSRDPSELPKCRMHQRSPFYKPRRSLMQIRRLIDRVDRAMLGPPKCERSILTPPLQLPPPPLPPPAQPLQPSPQPCSRQCSPLCCGLVGAFLTGMCVSLVSAAMFSTMHSRRLMRSGDGTQSATNGTAHDLRQSSTKY